MFIFKVDDILYLIIYDRFDYVVMSFEKINYC